MFSWLSAILSSIFGARSEHLVDKLDIPADSKRFVAALRVPDDPSCIVYLLTAQVLSERSARDAKQLVAAVRPHAVIAAVQSHLMLEFLEEERIAWDLDRGVVVPDSFLDAFTDFAISSYSSDTLAALDFQRIIFGTTYHGYALTAKRAARQSGSDFLVLQVFPADSPEEQHQSPDHWGLPFSRSLLNLPSTSRPQFAASFFPIFLMLDQLNHSIWPRTHGSNAFAAAERIIADTAAGKEVSRDLFDSVRRFRVTLEYFRLLQHDISRRIAMNAPPPFALSYTGLPDREKCEILVTQALQRQAKRSKVVVAVLDGSQVLGVRKYWNVLVPPEVAAMSDSFVFGDSSSTQPDEAGGNLVALGAGAAALAGATKFLSGKAPVLTKLPWAPFSPARSSIVRAFVGYAKRKSLGAVHWSFYGLMRDRTGMPSLRRPWVVFGGSVLTAVGLFCAEDQIGGAVEAVPLAVSVARLGRGLKNLKRTAAEANSEMLDDLYGPAYRVSRMFD